MQNLARLSLSVILSFIVTIVIHQSQTLAAPVEAFARMPKFQSVSVSPDGRYLAAGMNDDGESFLVIYDIGGAQAKMTHASKTADFDVRWTEWASNTRVLISLGFSSRRYGTPTYETRLLAINYDGSKPIDMVKQKRNDYAIQIQDNVIDFLTNDPEHVLMSHNADDPRKPRVYKTNIFTGRGRVIQGGKKEVTSWRTDPMGNVRLGWGQKDKQWQYIVKRTPDSDWSVLRSWGALSTENFGVMGFSRNPNLMFVRSNHEGGTDALYEYDLRSDRFTRKIFSNPEVDVASVRMNKYSGAPDRVSYVLDGTHHKWLNQGLKKQFETIEKALPAKGITITDSSPDNRIWIIHAGNVTDPGRYYIYNSDRRSLTTLGDNYPELSGQNLGKMIPYSYQARDGLRIPGYVTLPPNYSSLSEAKRLPMVVMPHGGPTSRDYLAFDPFVQQMTNRGYAVFQMNFRGSWGYGAEFEAAGYQEWGGKMQDDVTDGVNSLISMGLADPNRICISGISYGGYAAIMGAVKTPDLYKCAIGANGVYDLRDVITADRRYIGGRSGLRTAHIGNLSDKEYLNNASPSKRAHEIKIPILLVATDNDRTVRPSQSKEMASALKRNKVKYKFLELEDGGHSFLTAESRLDYMTEVDKFLAKHLK